MNPHLNIYVPSYTVCRESYLTKSMCLRTFTTFFICSSDNKYFLITDKSCPEVGM